MDGLCLAVGFLILGDQRPVIHEGRIMAQLTQFSKSQIKALSAFGVMARLHNSVNLKSKSCWPFVSWHNSHNLANLKSPIHISCHGTINTAHPVTN